MTVWRVRSLAASTIALVCSSAKLKGHSVNESRNRQIIFNIGSSGRDDDGDSRISFLSRSICRYPLTDKRFSPFWSDTFQQNEQTQSNQDAAEIGEDIHTTEGSGRHKVLGNFNRNRVAQQKRSPLPVRRARPGKADRNSRY